MSKKGKPLKFFALLAIALFFLNEAYFNLPVTRRLFPTLMPRPANLIAKIFDQTITRSQLDRAVQEKLWLEGRTTKDLTPADRKAALDELICHEILRTKIKEQEKPPLVSPDETNDRLRRLLGRFETQGALETAMKSQGIHNEDDLKNRLAARIQQEKFIESRIASQIKVTDEEARKWFETNSKDLANPARVEARHIFIPTLDHPPEEAKQKLDEALAALTEKKKDFATLAKELSEDPATKDSGGALGWMSYERLPVDFAAPLFSLEANRPTLIRSRLGWHLAEVTARKPAEPRTFEQAKPEILAALEAIKRRTAVAAFQASLLKDASGNVSVFEP